MTSEMPHNTDARRRSAAGYGWYAVGVVTLMALLAVAILYGRRPASPISQEVWSDLVEVDRITAKPGDLRGFNVLIVTTDTTRADHIGCYGNRAVKTPVIDSLAEGGVLCSMAIVPSPATLPSHASLMTGLFPCHHGARANGTFRLEDRIETLAEILGEKGYRTAAMISAFVLDSRFGLDQGFEVYDDDLTKGMKYSHHMFRERAGELTNEPVCAWLRENGHERFFMWVHYFDPHAAYLPPEPFRTRYANNLYDGEIAYADSQIGVLIDQLDELGVRDKTLVVYTSDHGEGLGEHGEQTHSLLVYDSTLHVPLIFHAPSRLPKGRVLHRLTSLVDVMPTVLSLLGEPVPSGLDGIDLTRPPGPGPRSVSIETISTMTLHGWAPLLGVRRDDYKYILAPTPELYDVKTDPHELDNLHDDEPEVVAELSVILADFLGGDPYLAAKGIAPNLAVDQETLRHLAALGYVTTVPQDSNESARFNLDPKEMVYHWEKLQRGINLRAQGRMSEALPILEECVDAVEGDIFARQVLAGCYMMRGEYAKALEICRRSVELQPNDESLQLTIAAAHLARGELKQAEEAIDRALAIEPESAHCFIQRGRIALRRQNEEEALQNYERAIEMDPGSSGPGAYNEIGLLHLRARRLEQARQAFRNAIRIDTLNAFAHDGLANVLIEEGKLDEAEAELAVALRFDPGQPRALSTLASLKIEKDELDQAINLCERALDLAPKFPQAHANIGLAYRRQDRLDLAEEHYLKAIEYGPFLDAAHINLAQLRIRQGDYDEGMQEFRRALRVNPYNRIALANLGVHQFNNGEAEKAFKLYSRALLVDPDYALVHRYIASIHALRDDPQQAAFHLRRSNELDPEQPEAEQLRIALTQVEEEAARRRKETADDEPSDEPSAPPP